MHLFELAFSPDICPGVKLQDHMVTLVLVSNCEFDLHLYCWLMVLVIFLPLDFYPWDQINLFQRS